MKKRRGLLGYFALWVCCQFSLITVGAMPRNDGTDVSSVFVALAAMDKELNQTEAWIRTGWLHNVRHEFITETEHPYNDNGTLCEGCPIADKGKSPDEMKYISALSACYRVMVEQRSQGNNNKLKWCLIGASLQIY